MAFKGLGVMTDNNPQARRAKIAIRQNVLDGIGRKAGVFDAFAGSGEMYSAVWLHAGGYVGCDPKPQSDATLGFRSSSLPIGAAWRQASVSAWC